MVPVFIHIMANGDIWVANDITFTPSGTVAAVFRVNPGVHSQKLGTVSGTSPNYACTNGSTNKWTGGEKV